MTSEFVMTPCEASAVLPAQMARGVRWDGDTCGPRALMVAVLEDAVRCIEEGRCRRRFHTRRLAAEAAAWVCCDRREWPFSFVNICEVLGFDVDAVRARLLTSTRGAADRRRARARVRVRSAIRNRATTLPPQRRRRADIGAERSGEAMGRASRGGVVVAIG